MQRDKVFLVISCKKIMFWLRKISADCNWTPYGAFFLLKSFLFFWSELGQKQMLKECNFPWDGETGFYLSFLQTQIVKGPPPAHFSSVVSYHIHFCYLADLCWLLWKRKSCVRSCCTMADTQILRRNPVNNTQAVLPYIWSRDVSPGPRAHCFSLF